MLFLEGPSNHTFSAQRMLRQLQVVVSLASFSVVILTAGLPIYSTEIGASGFEVGQLYAIGALMTAVARPIIGRALDLYGRKLFLLVGIAILAISMVLFAASRSVIMLLIASTTQGFGLGTMLLSAYAMTADLTAAEGRGGSFGGTEQAQYQGGLYGGLLAIPILFLTGFNPQGQLRVTPTAWSLMFVLYAVSALVALIIAGFMLVETYNLVQHTEEKIATINHNKINPQLYVLMAIVGLTSASSSGIAPFILKFIQDHITQDVSMIALAYLPASIVWGFLPSKMGIFADRLGRKPPIAIGLLVSGAFSAVIPFITALFPLMAFATVEAVCYSAAVPAEQALVADMTGGKQRGIGFGLYTLGMSAGRVVGPLVMGWLYDQYRTGPFFANAMILLIGTLLVLFVLRDPARLSKAASQIGR
ncbi:MAG: MFS transporter [Chloroflexi bacterium]|nr:MFS transporter [Chloroflexota bacterium]